MTIELNELWTGVATLATIPFGVRITAVQAFLTWFPE